ncbi:MAG: hypothetical protein IKD31_04115 [Clostridia bacterium]|nr:hypothetical protein [Clostridia bacterium]
MPATMMHLYAGHSLLPEGSDLFFLGCILPDCLDFDREKKDRFHLRDIPPEDRFVTLIRFGQGLDLKKDFDFGVFLHLYLDYLWDNGPQKAHRLSYTGKDLWFRVYRGHLAKAGSRVAQRFSWAKPLWERLREYRSLPLENSLALPEEEIDRFMAFNVRWHTEEALEESEVFTDALVDSFIGRAVESFRKFLSDFFPEIARLWL